MVNKGTCRGVYESKTNVDKVVCEGNLSERYTGSVRMVRLRTYAYVGVT